MDANKLLRAYSNGERVFGHANLAGVNLAGANIPGISFIKSNLCGANLSGADLAGASFFGANLAEANLAGANLLKADFRVHSAVWANLTESNLTRADLDGAHLCKAIFTAAKFTLASAHRANFSHACLQKADLALAILGFANFTGANLTGARLEDAGLVSANFADADLSNTCIDPTAEMPVCDLTELEIDGDYVIGWRTKTSTDCGNTCYQVGQCYTAPYFSVATNCDCHPGIYLATQAWLALAYPFTRRVKVKALKAETIKAGNKYRAKRIWVLEDVDDNSSRRCKNGRNGTP